MKPQLGEAGADVLEEASPAGSEGTGDGHHKGLKPCLGACRGNVSSPEFTQTHAVGSPLKSFGDVANCHLFSLKTSLKRGRKRGKKAAFMAPQRDGKVRHP